MAEDLDRIIVKSDQEVSIIDAAKGIAEARVSQYGTALENSSVGDPDSNGTIERAVQDVEQQVRVLRAALEIRVNQKIHLSDKIVPWMVRHAACLIARCRIRPCGKTSHQLMKGRRTNAKLAEFGEGSQRPRSCQESLKTYGAKGCGWDSTCGRRIHDRNAHRCLQGSHSEEEADGYKMVSETSKGH